jgi:hypothetical protein
LDQSTSLGLGDGSFDADQVCIVTDSINAATLGRCSVASHGRDNYPLTAFNHIVYPVLIFPPAREKIHVDDWNVSCCVVVVAHEHSDNGQ